MTTLEASYKSWGICAGKALVRSRADSSRQTPVDSEITLDEALAILQDRYGELAEDNGIFAAHAEIAADPMLYEAIENAMAEGLNLYDAAGKAGSDLEAIFDQIDDEYIRARKDDVKDVVGQLRDIIAGNGKAPETGPDDSTEGTDGKIILVSDEFLPSDIASMDFSKICGLISETGNRTGHVSIIAKAKGIPVLTGIRNCTVLIHSGDTVILDGGCGRIIIDPDEETLKKAADRAGSGASPFAQVLRLYSDAGVRVYANAGNTEDVRRAVSAGAAGIGLYRSEFLFMGRTDGFPDEETQFAAYREAAEICGNLPVAIRTLDIGGDKALPYFPMKREDNPFLGCRAVRLSLTHPKIFRTQLRAILRASAFGNVRIMFPMICTLGELREAKRLLEECKSALRNEGIRFNENIPAGMMVETPAAALKAEQFAREADFFSIGTNDLTQYVMAADRGNGDVAGLYDCNDEAVLSCIKMTIEAADKAGIEAEICGEMASEADSAAKLISLGLKAASVAFA